MYLNLNYIIMGYFNLKYKKKNELWIVNNKINIS